MMETNAHRQRAQGETLEISVDEALDLGRKVLARVDYDSKDAEDIVRHMIDGLWSGYPHTGISRVLAIIDEPRTYLPRKAPEVTRDTRATASIDGHNTVGYVTAKRACEVTIEKAKATGISCVTFFNTYFSGRNSYYLDSIAKAGLIGIHAVSTPAWVAPYGGRKPALGVNPIGFAFPADPHPIICDFGTASFMWGEIILHRRMGRSLPEGVAIDPAGNETTDPQSALDGAILPFGGHKGSTLNLAVQLLGALSLQEAREDANEDFGFIFMAVDPKLFVDPEVYKANVQSIVSSVAKTPPRPGYEVRVPSSRSRRLHTEAAARGLVQVEKPVYERLRGIANNQIDVEPVEIRGASE